MRLDILNHGYRPGTKLLTRQGTISAEDIRPVLAAGVTPQQIKDALAVCAAFNTTNRLAGTFAFELLTPEAYRAGANYLLKRGYQ